MSKSPTQSAGEKDGGTPLAVLRMFETHSLGVHLAVLGGLLLVWCGLAYTVFESGIITTSPLASGADGQAARRLVGGLVGFIVGGLFGVATLRSLGGPVVNAVLSGLYAIIGPLVLFPVVYEAFPAVYSPASNRFAVETLIATMPGLIGFFVVGWLYVQVVWSEGDRERWLESLPENPVVTPAEQRE